jgi:intracellular multiplication protein IcmO
MALDQKKYDYGLDHTLRDTRPFYKRFKESVANSDTAAVLVIISLICIFVVPEVTLVADLVFALIFLYFLWLRKQDRALAFKMPMSSPFKDSNNVGPGRSGQAEGILYVGNKKGSREEIWFTDSDARTHILYLGTTGAGKTEGLKSMVTNALSWGSGFIYVDGKADTDLWSSLSALCRRFGRDDDLLVLNYMTGNSDTRAPSNSLNPFSSGSASYLTNMLTSLMPEAEGDNAMWKERAVSLLSSLMPALTYKRDYQEMPLSISTIRNFMTLGEVIRLSRDKTLPQKYLESINGYLDTLPGFVPEAYDDNGKEKPAGPDQPMVDTSVASQQHGYLAMQFTRALQSLGDDYGYIFDVDNADVDMVDVVLNRRILVVLIPALEKSSDETANLGKIVAATLKGMMGSTLGAHVEGTAENTIENKQSKSSTPFMTVFDEVGYYTAQGMAVMAAQARSLGFCLIYSAQDLPALQKRVKEEARSITANCNLKIFGKLEDPTDTKDFFEKTVGQALVTEVSSFNVNSGGLSGGYMGGGQASIQLRGRASYDGLKSLKEGQSVVCFGDQVVDVNIFYSNPGHAKAMRVQRFVGMAPPNEYILKHMNEIGDLRDRLVSKKWTAKTADVATHDSPDIKAMLEGFTMAQGENATGLTAGAMALVNLYAQDNPINPDQVAAQSANAALGGTPTPKIKTSTEENEPKDPSKRSWKDIIGASTLKKKKAAESSEDDEEEEGSASGTGSSGGKKPKNVKEVPLEQFDAEDAVDLHADEGITLMPEGLSEDVMNILKEAADNISSGLFSKPELEKKAGADMMRPDGTGPTAGTPQKSGAGIPGAGAGGGAGGAS